MVLSDVAMPHMDGIELCRRLKSDLNTSHIPVILLTARSALMYRIDGLETGADDYMTKPFNMQLLCVRIRNLLRIRENLRARFGRTVELTPSAVTVNSLDEDFLRRLIGAVEQHIDESEFSVDDLAHALAMSRIQLYRKIKALTGETPNNVVRGIRLKRAAQLLATGQFNVSEVAYKVGFTDLKYFRERFREQFGVNPGEYEGKPG
jgi:YesN/AraC family two-component response regulator